MKTKLFVLALTLGLSSVSHAQFGGLGGFGGKSGGGGGDVSAQVDSFNKDAVLIRNVVDNSLQQIVGALGDKTQLAAVKEQAANLAKTTDTKEAENLQGTIVKNNLSAATELIASKDAKEKMEKLSPEMKEKVGKAIFSIGVAAIKLPDTVQKGKGIIESVGSNPMNISKALPVKNGLSLFADILPKLPTLVSTGMSLMKDVKVNPGNPGADSKMEVIKPTLPADEG